jgi:hemerythrin-like metal-binding protein
MTENLRELAASAEMFPWTPAYAVGVPSIDAEHVRLFALAANMHRAMLEGKGKAILENLLAQLVDYTCYHFAREERLMERVRYPGSLPHRREHEDLRSSVQAKRARAASGEVTMTIEVMQFLMDWVKRHIVESDRRIGDYLEANRLTPPPAVAP